MLWSSKRWRSAVLDVLAANTRRPSLILQGVEGPHLRASKIRRSISAVQTSSSVVMDEGWISSWPSSLFRRQQAEERRHQAQLGGLVRVFGSPSQVSHGGARVGVAASGAGPGSSRPAQMRVRMRCRHTAHGEAARARTSETAGAQRRRHCGCAPSSVEDIDPVPAGASRRSVDEVAAEIVSASQRSTFRPRGSPASAARPSQPCRSWPGVSLYRL